MSQRIKASKTRRRRGITLLWIGGMALVTFLLIYFEQTALLYVLATLGVTVLMVIVAMADLGDRKSNAAPQGWDAQAAGSGISSSVKPQTKS